MRTCDVKGCSNKHVAHGLCNKHRMQMRKRATGKRKGRPPGYTPEQKNFAEYLLDDGASYKEVSRSTGIAESTLRGVFPGKGWTYKEGQEFVRWIASNDRRQTLYFQLIGERVDHGRISGRA